MSHGNPLLRGWALSDVSSYTTELPQYLLIEAVRGLAPDVVHEAAAMTYTLPVLVTAWLAKGRATGREALVRVLIPAGIMLAPPLGPVVLSRADSPAWVLLSAPDHAGTQVPLLLAWLLLDRAPRRWQVPVAMTVLLAWVQVATASGMAADLWPKLANLLALFGADFFGLPAAQVMLPLAHLIAVAIVAWAAASAVRRFLAHDDLATQVLTASFFVLLAAFAFGYRTGARQAVGLLPVGAALAGRLLTDRVLRCGAWCPH